MLSARPLLFRRVLMVLGAFVLCTAGAAVSARAQLEQALFTHSRTLLDLPRAWMRGPARTIAVNGARFELTSGRSELELSALLDHLEDACRQVSRGLSVPKRALSRAKRARSLLGFSEGVWRVENAREGVVACFALGEAPLSWDELLHKLERFASTLDLAELGGIRFIRAEALERGSFFVGVQNLGSAPLLHMFPSEGDAPGVDPPNVPRPPAARRTFSAYQEEREPGIFQYESAREADELWNDYGQILLAQGYDSGLPFESGYAHAALFTRGGSTLIVALERLAEGGTRVLVLQGGGELARR